MAIYYRRNLPHFQPPNTTFHTVFRLAGSLPDAVVRQLMRDRLREEKRIARISSRTGRRTAYHEHQRLYFERFDGMLDRASTGPRWLADPRLACVVMDGLRFRDGREYDLHAFTLMSNHVHLVIGIGDAVPPRRLDRYRLTSLLQSLKWYTARRCNEILARTGSFWHHESYDHVIRSDGEFERTIWYVVGNPVNAGLTASWESWPWTYLKDEYVVGESGRSDGGQP